MQHPILRYLAGVRGLLPLLLSVAMLAGMLTSCDDYDTWTTSPEARLSFSEDTIDFSSVITGQGSTTRTLIVSNGASRGVRIRSVRLEQGVSSPFRINVDGEYLPEGEGVDYEIRQRDSIFVRVEVTLPETDGTPHHYQDCIQFTLESGVTQTVPLLADGLDVYVLQGLVVERDTTLTPERPFVVRDSLVVRPGACLTLSPGVTLMFHDGVSMHLYGSLQAVGTMEQPITLRGDRVDNMFDYLPYDNTPNRWGGIHIHAESLDNVLYQCDIHSGDYGIRCDSSLVMDAEHPALTMENSVLHNVGGPALQLHQCISRIIGCQISNSRGRCVDILGGAHDFVHCTIAQFYPWKADRAEALYLANADEDGEYCHLYWAHFLNCVVTGYAEDVIMGNIVEGGDYLCDYLFHHCLLRTVRSDDDERFREVIYEDEDLKPQGSAHFCLFDTDNFLYDFTPDSTSIIRGLADVEFALQVCPYDRRGVSRMQDGHPDAGCYEGVYAE